MAISGIDHVNIDTARPDETLAFWTDVMGFENRPQDRPDFGFPGAWLWSGDRAVVHLNFREEDRGADTGSFNHVAFEASGFDEMVARLDAHGLEYKTAERPEIQLRQIFVSDPNGVKVELNLRGE